MLSRDSTSEAINDRESAWQRLGTVVLLRGRKALLGRLSLDPGAIVEPMTESGHESEPVTP